VAFAGDVMPQKSTDFFPKLLSGLAFMRWILDGARHCGGDDARVGRGRGCGSPRRDCQPRQCRGLPESARGLATPKSGPAVHLFLSSLPRRQDARFLPWKTAQSAWIGAALELAGE
jgi:hypothetical protein